ncbi:MAG: hypothetical protein DCC68_12120 [Planctomycetota bacterium]|nr:MAG: hypothetical protein DCC68_12120 [Planctomycetota bacterium]
MDLATTQRRTRRTRLHSHSELRRTRLSLEHLESRQLLAVVGPTIDLANLGNLGFAIDGAAANAFAGYSVGPAGDVNNDGFADVVVGAHNATIAGRTQSGETYVVFGAASGIPASVDAAALNGTNGFRIRGAEAFDRSGFSVRTAGDVNGDGVDDLILGSFDTAQTAGLDQVGQAYVVFGRTTAFPSVIDLASMGSSVGFQIRGAAAFDKAGWAVSAAGDVNGDGIGDVLVGAPEASPNGNVRSGQAYVVFGRTTGFGTLVTLASLTGANGFVINGAAIGDYAGASLSSAGDVNGDGFDDILIGAYRADPGGRDQAGRAYVVFGKASGFAPQLNLSSLDGANGFALNGIAASDAAGRAVGRGGDINGDGYDDLIIGAWDHSEPGEVRVGEVYVVFGHGGAFPAQMELSSLNGTNGFALVGIDPADRAGRSVDGAGDVNGDGFDDLILGAVRGDPLGRTDAGEAYLVFGKAGGFAAEQSLETVDGLNGLTIQGAAANDLAGSSVAGAGDVNGDGFDDVIVGAYYADPAGRSNAGRGYVLFGGQFNDLALAVANVAAAPEGQASAFDVTFQNYGHAHTLTIDWGDGSLEQIALGAATSSVRPTHVYADNGSYSVSLTLVDQQSPERTATGGTTFGVGNAAPVFGSIGFQQAAEGALYSLAGIAFTDPGFDNPSMPGGATTETFTYQVDWGDNSAPSSGAATVTVAGSPGVATQGIIPATHHYADNGVYTVSVTVTDDDGGTRSTQFPVNVTNIAPAVILNTPSAASEGSLVTLSATVLDPGYDNPTHPNGPTRETFSYWINWGDGTLPVVLPVVTVTPGGPGVPTTGEFQASHRYADGGSYGIVVTLVDDDAGSSTQLRTVSITNVAPQVTAVGNQAALQGIALSISDIATFSDPGFSSTSVSPPSSETFMYTIDWGDGSPLDAGVPTIDVPGAPGVATQGSLDAVHVYLATGTFTVTVRVRDDEGGLGSASFQVTVTGVPPVLSAIDDRTATEGLPLAIAEIATFIDRDGGEYAYTIDWGDGSPATAGDVRRGETFGEDLNRTNLSGGGTASRIPHPNADSARNALVGLAANGTATESFENLPTGTILIPRFLNLGGQTAVLSAGQSIRAQPTGTLNGAFPTTGDKMLFVDAGPIGPVFSIDFAQPQIGVGFYVTDAENPGNITVEFVLADGSTTIRRLLPTMASPTPGNNNDGSVAYYGLVDPSNPFIRFTVLRNQTTTDGFGIDDITLVLPGETGPAIADSLLYVSDVSAGAILRGVAGGSHTYADDGVYTATLRVTDPSGASSSRPFQVTVGNVAPTLAVSGAANVNEGTAYQLTLGAVVDPGSDTVSQWRIDWNDGSPIDVFTSPPGTIAHVFADGPEERLVQVTLVDEDGSHLAATQSVSVANVAPIVDAGNATTIDAGAALTRTGTFADPGSDTWTAEVDYGDGAGFAPLALAANKQFTLNHDYPAPGSHTVTVRVADDDGGVGTDSFTVTVRSGPPTVTLNPQINAGWIQQFGTSANEEGRAMAIDAAGNSYFAGYTQGDLVVANLGSNDVILGKIDPAGNRLWTIQFGTPEGDVARGVAVDADGNVFVSGDTIGSLGGPNAGQTDAFLSKYTADGQLIWSQQLGSPALDVNRGLALDADGNAYIVGGTNGDLGGTNLAGTDGYIAKYDTDGNLLWTRILGTTGDNDSFLSVAVDAAGNVYGGGVTNGDLAAQNAGALDAFVARYDREGNRVWTRQLGTSADEIGHNVRLDANGNVYTTGTTSGSLAGPNRGGSDFHVHKFDPQGTLLWAVQDGTSAADQQRGLAVDAEGNVIVAGFTAGNFGRPNLGVNDLFLARYDTAGTRQSVLQFGTQASDLPWGAAVDAAGNVYLAAISQGSLAANHAGGWDVVFAKLSATAIATEGTPLVAVDLATFADFDLGNYTYSIDWGDGTNPDNGSVSLTSGEGAVFFDNDGSVYRANLDGSNMHAVYVRPAGVGNEAFIDVDRTARKLYYYGTRNGSGMIWRSNYDGSDLEYIVEGPQVSTADIYGFAVSPSRGELYFGDHQRGIQVANLDGTNIRTIVDLGLQYTHDIEVDVQSGLVYYTNADSIRRMDAGTGANDQQLKKLDVTYSSVHIAFDSANAQFYFTASNIGRTTPLLGRGDLSGDNIGTFFQNVRAFDIELDSTNSKLYWSTATHIQRSNLNGSGIEDILALNIPGTWKTLSIALDPLAPISAIGFGSLDGQHTYADDGQYHVVVRLTDPTGQTSVRSFFATVANASPTVALAGDAAIDEGAAYSLAVGPVADSGADTVSEWRVDWNDGLVDDDGVHVGAVHAVTVNNVAPSVDAGEDVTTDPGTTVVRGGSFDDPGDDAWTAEVDYGDGGGFVPLALAADNTFTLELQYATPGTKAVQVRVTDDDGGVGVDLFQVIVEPTFLVSSLAPTSTGFVVTFDRPVDASSVNLYDGPDAEVEPADATLVGDAVGPVAGSLVWNAAYTQFTFIKTGAPLAADTYRVRLSSRASGFVDTAGNLLDGDGDFSPGGDYENTFTVASANARVVSLPDFARGPTQAVHVPNTSTGMPVRLSDGSGVLSVDLDVVYDPALLNISSIARAAGVPTNWTVTANLTQPGRARVTASGVTALSAGPVDVLRIAATVPTAAAIGDAQIVRLENVRVNGGLIASIADAALHKVAFLADVDGNFAYTAFDAAFISRVVVGFDTGFDAFPLVDPVVIGNSSGTGSLSGLDAAYVAQKAVFLPRPEIPDLPPNLPAPSPAAVDPAIGVPAAVFAQAGASAHVPVTVDDLDGLFGVTLRVNYETGPLDLANEQVTLAAELEAAGWSLVQNVDDSGGVAYLAAFSAQPGTAGAATLVDMHFNSLASAAGTTLLDLSGPASDGGFSFTYIDGTLTLTVPGDVNLDGAVGLADIAAVQRNFGKLVDAAWTDGDLDGDGDVDRADLAIVASNFGRLPAPAAPLQAPEAVVTAAIRPTTLVARRKAKALSPRGADAVLADALSHEAPAATRRALARAAIR